VVTFQNSASTFKALTALGQNAINVNVPVETTVGNLFFTANTQGDAGQLNLNADLTAAGSMTLSANAATAGTHQAGIILGAPVVLTANGVTITSELNGAQDLTINSGSGTTTFNSGGAVPTTIGLITPLTSLTITGATDLNITNIQTSGAQLYNSPVNVGSAITLASTSGGNINLANTVNGAFGLTINTAGVTTVGGIVGGITPLASITTDSPGSVTINMSAISTSGAQTYNEATITAGTLTLNAGGNVFGNINLTALFLNVNSANMTGTVNGLSGLEAARAVQVLNSIGPGLDFFNGYDLAALPPTPTPAPTPSPTPNANPLISMLLQDPSLAFQNDLYTSHLEEETNIQVKVCGGNGAAGQNAGCGVNIITDFLPPSKE
jgi:hypothetical protein